MGPQVFISFLSSVFKCLEITLKEQLIPIKSTEQNGIFRDTVLTYKLKYINVHLLSSLLKRFCVLHVIEMVTIKNVFSN